MIERAKAYEYLLRRIDPGGSIEDLLRFPKYLEIETINACNARCRMCTINDWRHRPGRMSDELFAKLADEICANAGQVKRVSLYRDGEPLLDTQLCERIRRLKNGGVPEVAVSSNVSLLDEAKGKDLLDAGVDLVLMSIDSLRKPVYEDIRLGLNFEQVLANAKAFIGLRDRLRPQTRIWMRMVRQQSNYDEWPEYRDFWQELLQQGDRVYYHNLFNWGGQLEEEPVVAKSYEPNLPCVALWSLLVVTVNGQAQLCNVDYLKKHPLGDLNIASIGQVWNSDVLQTYRERHLQLEKGRVDICRTCNVWDEPESERMISADYAEAVDLQRLGNKGNAE